jgi:hypothetical protein
MAAERRLAETRDRALAIAASAAAHAIFLLWILWRLGASPPLAETPIMSVELTRPSHDKAREPPPQRNSKPTARPPSILTSPPDDHPSAPVPETREVARPGEGIGAARQALRGLLGCEHAALAGLTSEERERCRERLGAEAGRAGGGGRLNLDPRGAFATDAEPYLARKPKKGCKPRAGGDVGAMGEIGAAGGVTCAWSF